MKLSVKELAVFGMLGTLMCISKYVMEFLPNMHLLAVFTVAFTVVFRKKALYSIYIFVFLVGLFSGFSVWWLPYLYIWAVLWGAVMLIPKNINPKIAPFVYIAVCSLHGFLYGTIYAPAQALLFGLDFKGIIAWIVAGLPFDMVHGFSNLILGVLIVPIIKVLNKLKTL
ncbi:MAG: hypothetical protein UHM16_05635 [Acutalibacteraceae bacterium]|nr:hypothetical protein [Acutalibacteraceae bacterium]